jgi:hypothetical protein
MPLDRAATVTGRPICHTISNPTFLRIHNTGLPPGPITVLQADEIWNVTGEILELRPETHKSHNPAHTYAASVLSPPYIFVFLSDNFRRSIYDTCLKQLSLYGGSSKLLRMYNLLIQFCV